MATTKIRLYVPLRMYPGRGAMMANAQALRGMLAANTPEGRKRIHRAIAIRLRQMAVSTFGPAGRHRPAEWPDLSPRYKKRIRYFGPPKLVLTGRMIRSFRVGWDSNHAVVMNTAPYAQAHQHGAGNMPSRPFFPVLASSLTPFANAELVRAATREIARM